MSEQKPKRKAVSERKVKKCPKCSGEMDVGYLHNAQYWTHGRSRWSIGWDGRVFAYKCKNCGYVEFYFEKK